MYTTRSCFRPTYLVKTIQHSFQKSFSEPVSKKGFSLIDCLLSAFAMFHLKYPSLLQFDEACRDEGKLQNIKSLYGVSAVPCDTTMRERLDPLFPQTMNEAIHAVIGMMQRSQSLQEWDYLKTKLVSLDGTGFFS